MATQKVQTNKISIVHVRYFIGTLFSILFCAIRLLKVKVYLEMQIKNRKSTTEAIIYYRRKKVGREFFVLNAIFKYSFEFESKQLIPKGENSSCKQHRGCIHQGMEQ